MPVITANKPYVTFGVMITVKEPEAHIPPVSHTLAFAGSTSLTYRGCTKHQKNRRLSASSIPTKRAELTWYPFQMYAGTPGPYDRDTAMVTKPEIMSMARASELFANGRRGFPVIV
jgi:hypothetical protein